MLRVMIELVPGGHENEARVIEQMLIANVSETTDVADYDFAMTRGGEKRYGTVYNHRRAYGAWDLVGRVLRVAASLKPRTETQKQLAERFTK